MTSPKHLWSGDWRADSAAAAEELAERRAAGHSPIPEPEPEPEARWPAPRAPEPCERRPRRRVSRQARVAILAAVVVLLAGGAAVALTDAFGTHKSRAPAGARAYLG